MATVSGGTGDDLLSGTPADDRFEGSAGADTATFTGRLAGYRFAQADGYLIVTDTNPTDGNDGTDTLRGVEVLRFADTALALSPGGEMRANDVTVDAQLRPEIAQLDDGGHVVVWSSYDQDGDRWGVFLQRYAANGEASGANVQANTFTADWQYQPSVGALVDGGFVVTWTSYYQDGGSEGIYAQRYGADGAAVGEEFRVNTSTADTQEESAIVGLADGGFLVSWQSYEQDGSSYGLYAQRYDAGGLAQGDEFRLNQYTDSSQEGVSIAALPAGGFIAVWSSYGQDGDRDGVYARRFAADGTPAGDEFRVNTTTTNSQLEPAVAVRADGLVAVAWTSYQGDSAGYYQVMLQLYAADGSAHGGETVVNTTPGDYQYEASLAFTADGNTLVVSWTSDGQDGDAQGVYGRAFTLGDTVAGGEEFRLTRHTAGAQYASAVAAAGANGFLAVWTSVGQDGSDSSSIFWQRFLPGADADSPWRAVLPELHGTARAERFDLGAAGGDLAAAGGGGNDVYVLDSAGDRVTERTGQGTDRIETPLAWSLQDNPGVEDLRLTGAADVAGTGSAVANRLWGNAGRNLLQGLAGNDTLDGGSGEDTLSGGRGDDTYVVTDAAARVKELASEGRDTLRSTLESTLLPANVENLVLVGSAALDGRGNALANVLTGSAIANLLDGRSGADTMAGGRGDDIYRVDQAGDRVIEQIGEGTDTVVSLVSYTLPAHVEQLKLAGSAALEGTGNFLANVLEGNAGANRLDGSTGADVLIGLAGDDTFYVDQSADTVIEAAGEGYDTVVASEAFTLPENVERMRFVDAVGGTRDYSGTGNAADNLLEGAGGNDALNGLGGNDTLRGFAGDDTLAGGAGVDLMTGGAGDDLYAVDSAGDTVVELPGEGTDRVESTVSYALPAAVEQLRLLGSANLSGTGNALANLIDGNSGDNLLSGGEGDDTLDGGDAGADTMEGGDGNDLYYVDDARDETVEAATAAAFAGRDATPRGAGGNIDTVIAQVSYTLRANVENLQLAGDTDLDGSGNALDNLLSGNAGDNRLLGLAGVDILDGGGGSDTLVGGAGRDTLAGGAGADVFLFDASLAANVDTVLDFVHPADRLQLDEDVFTAFTAGVAVSADQFRAGAGLTRASTAEHRLIYNTTSGDLYYDADGTGAQAAVRFAVLGSGTQHPQLSAADFVIVG